MRVLSMRQISSCCLDAVLRARAPPPLRLGAARSAARELQRNRPSSGFDFSLRPLHERSMQLDESVLAVVRHATLCGLAADVVEEPVHLALPLLHVLLHVEDDLDSGPVDADVAGQGEDDLEAADRLLVVEAGIAGGARRLEQPL